MKFAESHLDWLCELMADAARKEIMPRFRRLSANDIREKTSALDVVTDADVNAERHMTAALRERYPDALIVGEEAYAEDERVLEGLRGAALAFVLDPVDGTYNFAAGVAPFGVMMAVVVNGETVAGIIHDPLGEDWVVGVKGGGSHLRGGGSETAIHVAKSEPLGEMVGNVGWQYMQEPERTILARNARKVLGTFGYRCAAQEYRLLASGYGHFGIYNKLMPWDHLPGLLIHSEAGGYNARFDGSAYVPGDTTGGLLVAPDRAAWEAVRSGLWAD
ncbi:MULTISPECIES: inositol monophosphatase family protein [Mesorhizobium]|uniref:Inositol monophosphatase n=1 Tax=Mesorhizobium denitrificans TaxID=2294114 RepID=A0A371X954_9HYPH|nr:MULTISPECIES: inositol monophosphatase family protein [Mesorhizobium]RFC65743.1 inositol monophosphatase [Mesorhizobium denitrificans]